MIGELGWKSGGKWGDGVNGERKGGDVCINREEEEKMWGNSGKIGGKYGKGWEGKKENLSKKMKFR